MVDHDSHVCSRDPDTLESWRESIRRGLDYLDAMPGDRLYRLGLFSPFHHAMDWTRKAGRIDGCDSLVVYPLSALEESTQMGWIESDRALCACSDDNFLQWVQVSKGMATHLQSGK